MKKIQFFITHVPTLLEFEQIKSIKINNMKLHFKTYSRIYFDIQHKL